MHVAFVWPCGPTDKASDYGSGDSRFESWQGRFFFFLLLTSYVSHSPGRTFLVAFLSLRTSAALPLSRVSAWHHHDITYMQHYTACINSLCAVLSACLLSHQSASFVHHRPFGSCPSQRKEATAWTTIVTCTCTLVPCTSHDSNMYTYTSAMHITWSSKSKYCTLSTYHLPDSLINMCGNWWNDY